MNSVSDREKGRKGKRQILLTVKIEWCVNKWRQQLQWATSNVSMKYNGQKRERCQNDISIHANIHSHTHRWRGWCAKLTQKERLRERDRTRQKETDRKRGHETERKRERERERESERESIVVCLCVLEFNFWKVSSEESLYMLYLVDIWRLRIFNSNRCLPLHTRVLAPASR